MATLFARIQVAVSTRFVLWEILKSFAFPALVTLLIHDLQSILIFNYTKKSKLKFLITPKVKWQT
jgi:hypothetical protein